jgi:MraZ protein
MVDSGAKWVKVWVALEDVLDEGKSGVFVGKNVHTIDDKGRVVLPAPFRKLLEGSDRCYLAPSVDGCITLLREEDFQREGNKLMAEANTPQGRRKLRKFSSDAQVQRVDKAGRILINEDLRSFAGIATSSEVVVNGNFLSGEIWNPRRFDEQETRGASEFIESDLKGDNAD